MVSFSAALKQVLRKFAFTSKASGTRTEIQRVYIGLGAKLVKETLPLVSTSYVEMLIVMAKYNSFAEKAGM